MASLKWKITTVIDETPNTKSFVLENMSGNAVDYKAGQFLTFLIPFQGRTIRRSYSIASTPGVDEHIMVSVKRKVNGEMSRFIHEHWQPGTAIESLPPAGRFVIHHAGKLPRQYFFIVAGSGITPVYGLIKQVLHKEPQSHIVLLYQNTHPADTIYRQSLLELYHRFRKRFKLVELFSQPGNDNFPVQRLNNEMLEQLVHRHLLHDIKEVLFYTCGPVAFMRMAWFTLKLMGYEDEQLRKENFTVDIIPVPAFTMDPVPHNISIKTSQHHYHITTAWPTTILQGALDNKIELPYSCRAGRCSACVARCTSGKVLMSNNEVLTDKDLDEGWILTCTGYPETDITLEF